jgi:ABC-2 type transport system ATP-binding protein
VSLDIDALALEKRFGRTPAVDRVDLHAHGGVLGLLGPNGSGKTTLLRMLATVLAPDGGTVRLFGVDPARAADRTEIRRNLGYLPQAPGLYAGFTAFDLVDYVAVLKEMTDRRARHDEVRRVLADVGLSDVMHKKLRALSGGMRQRTALAAALLGEPRLLVLDEPAAGLDPEQRLRLRSILSSAGERGTVVLSTHHTSEVAAFCQRVVVMADGTTRYDGTPAGLSAMAEGRVWVDDRADPQAVQSWVTPEGTIRNIGVPPAGASLVAPTIDDGYLLLTSAKVAA